MFTLLRDDGTEEPLTESARLRIQLPRSGLLSLHAGPNSIVRLVSATGYDPLVSARGYDQPLVETRRATRLDQEPSVRIDTSPRYLHPRAALRRGSSARLGRADGVEPIIPGSRRYAISMRPVPEIKKQRAGQVSPTQFPPCGDPEEDGLWIVWDSVKNDFVATYPSFAEAISFRGRDHEANPQMPPLRVWFECECGWIGPEVSPRDLNPSSPPLMHPRPRQH